MKARSVVAVLAAALVLGACGDDSGAPEAKTPLERATSPRDGVPFEETVTITKSGYRPRVARVLLGGTVTWINLDPKGPHTAQTPEDRYEGLPGGQDTSFDSHTLSWEEPYSVSFHFPGTFDYESSYDSFTGKVEVVSRNPPGP
jgi:plastocyanin